MIILRRLTSSNSESNTSLGDSYNLIIQDKNRLEYEDTLQRWLHMDIKEDKDIYGFIIYGNGQSIIPLYNKSKYFVMTENGKTFANISLR